MERNNELHDSLTATPSRFEGHWGEQMPSAFFTIGTPPHSQATKPAVECPEGSILSNLVPKHAALSWVPSLMCRSSLQSQMRSCSSSTIYTPNRRKACMAASFRHITSHVRIVRSGSHDLWERIMGCHLPRGVQVKSHHYAPHICSSVRCSSRQLAHHSWCSCNGATVPLPVLRYTCLTCLLSTLEAMLINMDIQAFYSAPFPVCNYHYRQPRLCLRFCCHDPHAASRGFPRQTRGIIADGALCRTPKLLSQRNSQANAGNM